MTLITRARALAALNRSFEIAHTLGKLLNTPAASTAAAYSAIAGAGIAAVGATAMHQGNFTQGVALLATGTAGVATGGAAFVELLSEPDHAAQALQLNAALGEGLAQITILQTAQQTSVGKIQSASAEIHRLSADFAKSLEETKSLLEKQESTAAGSIDRLADFKSRFEALNSKQMGLIRTLIAKNKTISASLLILQVRLSQLQRTQTFSDQDLQVFKDLPDLLSSHFTETDAVLLPLLETSTQLQTLHLELARFSQEIQEEQRRALEAAIEKLAGAGEQCKELTEQNAVLKQEAEVAKGQVQRMQALNKKILEAQQNLTGHIESLIKTIASLKRVLGITLALSVMTISLIILVPAIKMALILPAVGALGAGVLYGAHRFYQSRTNAEEKLPKAE